MTFSDYEECKAVARDICRAAPEDEMRIQCRIVRQAVTVMDVYENNRSV